jgi:hypothetical protein
VTWMLRLYPPAWRRRYDAEMAALLEQHESSFATVLDLGRGAVDAWMLAGSEGLTMQILRRDAAVLRQSTVVGLLLGGVWIAYCLVNTLAKLDSTGNSVLNNGLTAALVLFFALAGFLGAWRTGRIRAGTCAAVLTWVVSSSIGIATLWIVTLLFFDTIRHNPFMIEDFQRSGGQSMDRFIIEDNLGATVFGSALALSAAAGTAGGLLGKSMARLRRA